MVWGDKRERVVWLHDYVCCHSNAISHTCASIPVFNMIRTWTNEAKTNKKKTTQNERYNNFSHWIAKIQHKTTLNSTEKPIYLIGFVLKCVVVVLGFYDYPFFIISNAKTNFVGV